MRQSRVRARSVKPFEVEDYEDQHLTVKSVLFGAFYMQIV
jgi:hypothetical protein